MIPEDIAQITAIVAVAEQRIIDATTTLEGRLDARIDATQAAEARAQEFAARHRNQPADRVPQLRLVL
jgi:hypothetical protein